MKLGRLLLLVILFASFDLWAQNIYQVSDVRVYVTAVNAKKAREIAIEKAQIDAFRTLVSEASLTEAQITQNKEDILNAAREYQIINEAMTRTSYRASLNIFFSKAHVNNILGNAGVDASKLASLKNFIPVKTKPIESDVTIDEAAKPDEQLNDELAKNSPTRLIVPITTVDGATILWNEQNQWLKLWQEKDSEAEALGIIVPHGDLEDISMTKFNILLANYNSFKQLAERYQAKEILIAFAEIKHIAGGYKIAISMKNLNQIHEHNYLKKYFELEGSSRDQLLLEAFDKILKIDPEKQFDVKNLDIQISDNIELDAIFNIDKFSDWLELSKKLEKINSIVRVKLVEFNDKTLIVNIVSKSDVATLKKNIAKKGYELYENEGKFIIKDKK